MTNSALQVTNFDFYGDELITIKDDTTNETYIPITPALRTIGFAKRQIKHYREKWSNDSYISKGIVKLRVPTKGGYQETYCLSLGKFFLALLKINITPKMRKTQPVLSDRICYYQIKLNDIIIDCSFNHPKSSSITSIQTMIDSINNKITQLEKQVQVSKTVNDSKSKSSHWSPWRSKVFNNCQILMKYTKIDTYKEIYRQLYLEFENCYPEFNLDDLANEYCITNNLKTCFTIDAIEDNKTTRELFEIMIDNLLDKYGLSSEQDTVTRVSTIFDN